MANKKRQLAAHVHDPRRCADCAAVFGKGEISGFVIAIEARNGDMTKSPKVTKKGEKAMKQQSQKWRKWDRRVDATEDP